MVDDLRSWVGRQAHADDVLVPTPCAALAATLDRDPARPPPGWPLPALWHWLYFLPLHRHSELGSDGHAKRGGFLPPIPLPRRMWAGGELAFHRPLRIGDAVVRTSTIESISAKNGRSGPLAFVRVKHEIRVQDDASVALTEFHDIVYRAAPKSGTVPPEPQAAPAHAAFERECNADAVMLFRYSALTFNPHRIHYDRRYAVDVEGYPGLVVHGPLIATLLLDLLRRERPDARVAQFRFRAVRPLFDGDPFFVCGQPLDDGRSFRLWARQHDGALAMDATATVD